MNNEQMTKRSFTMVTFFIILGAVIGVFLILLVAALLYFLKFGIVRDPSREGFYYNRDHAEKYCPPQFVDKIVAGASWIRDFPAEDLYMTSFDGLKLHGRLFEKENARATFIMCHGYRSSGYNDFSCIAKFLFDNNCNLLIIDQRSSNGSEGKYIGMGVLERYDCRDWAKLISERYPKKPIILSGVSMGASTVLMATGLELPKEVVGVTADCGFTSPRKIFTKVMKQSFKVAPRFFMALMTLLIKIVAKYDANYSAEDALRQSNLPLIISHGKADDFVPFYMSEQNIAAAQNCEVKFITSDEAEHAQTYLYKEDEMNAAILEMLDKYTTV